MKRKMKFILMLSIAACISLSSCKKNNPDNPGDPDTNETNQFDSFNCGTVLESGDYSDICGISTTTPNYQTAGSNQSSCTYVVSSDNGEWGLAIQINAMGSVNQANVFYDAYKNWSGFETSSAVTVTSTTNKSNIGNEAKIQEFTEDATFKHMTLTIRKSNAVIIINSSYEISDGKPCVHTAAELTKVGQLLLANL